MKMFNNTCHINGAEMAVRLGRASQTSPLPARRAPFRAIFHREIQHKLSAEAGATSSFGENVMNSEKQTIVSSAGRQHFEFYLAREARGPR